MTDFDKAYGSESVNCFNVVCSPSHLEAERILGISFVLGCGNWSGMSVNGDGD